MAKAQPTTMQKDLILFLFSRGAGGWSQAEGISEQLLDCGIENKRHLIAILDLYKFDNLHKLEILKRLKSYFYERV